MTLVPALFFAVLEGLLRFCGYGHPTGFFLESRIENEPVIVENAEFGRRFFPGSLCRAPLPQAMPAVKPPRTYRIFVLGESAAQGFPDPSFSFARILEVMLRERYPNTRFEIINTAMTAINSHVVLPIARDCAEHQPDLFIVYMGNNEVVGPFGIASVLGPYNPSRGLLRTHLAVKSLRTGQLLDDLGQLVGGRASAPPAWEGMAMFLKSQVRADDPRLKRLHANFRANLQEICAAGRESGARVIVCTVASNLKDCPPFGSLHRPDLTEDQVAAWEKVYAEGASFQTEHQPARAVERYHQAAEIDDSFAELHFRLARCLDELGQREEARREYTQARDLDTLRFRADTEINETIRAAAADAPSVSLVDVEQAFAESSAPGDDLLLEHVHMNFAGNYLLARVLFERVQEILPESVRGAAPEGQVLSKEQCAERLAYTDWNRYETTSAVAAMLRQPPFTAHLDHAERSRRLQKTLTELQPQTQPDALRKHIPIYQQALAKSPDDWWLNWNFARLLLQTGDYESSEAELQQVLKRLPNHADAYNQLAIIRFQQGKYAESITLSEKALRLAPDFAQEHIHFTLATTLSESGKPEQALEHFALALKLNPNSARTHFNMGNTLANQGQLQEALDHYAAGARLVPDLPELHEHWVEILVRQGKIDEAIAHYREVMETCPERTDIPPKLAELQRQKK